MNMERVLPTFIIEGVDFTVDVSNLRLYEKANPENAILVSDMRDVAHGYVFDYNTSTKNMTELFGNNANIISVLLPPLVQLDPAGMAEKYGHTLSSIVGKADFDLMVDQAALKERLMGRLTTVDIAGHTFYVDIRMDMLRPKDDFLSKGIVFKQIDHYYNDELQRYIIPYNLKKHELQELDYENIIAIPKDLIAVSFPHESVMDPIGFNRKEGWDETFGLKNTNIHAHFNAAQVNWSDTGIQSIIEDNKRRLGLLPQQTKLLVKRAIKQRKGPRPH